MTVQFRTLSVGNHNQAAQKLLLEENLTDPRKRLSALIALPERIADSGLPSPGSQSPCTHNPPVFAVLSPIFSDRSGFTGTTGHGSGANSGAGESMNRNQR
jgi:hypothetical protein